MLSPKLEPVVLSDEERSVLDVGRTQRRRRPQAGRRQETMHQQLNHLMSLSQLNHVNIVILPFSAGAHPAMHGPCTLLRFPKPADPDVAYVQYRRGSVYLEDPADIGHYVEVFDHLRSRALGPDESRALIASVADDMSRS